MEILSVVSKGKMFIVAGGKNIKITGQEIGTVFFFFFKDNWVKFVSLYFLAIPCGLQDFSPPTRYQPHAFSSESAES